MEIDKNKEYMTYLGYVADAKYGIPTKCPCGSSIIEEIDPEQDRMEIDKNKEYMTYLGYVADAEYGIPTKCPCGSSIIEEVGKKGESSMYPGRRFFTCKNYEYDGLHHRQPWVCGIQEEIERLIKRVEEAEKVMKGVTMLESEIAHLKAQVGLLNGQVDILKGHVDILEGQISTLERVCYD